MVEFTFKPHVMPFCTGCHPELGVWCNTPDDKADSKARFRCLTIEDGVPLLAVIE